MCSRPASPRCQRRPCRARDFGHLPHPKPCHKILADPAAPREPQNSIVIKRFFPDLYDGTWHVWHGSACCRYRLLAARDVRAAIQRGHHLSIRRAAVPILDQDTAD